MAILRAGPFATPSSSFVDQPDPPAGAVPVNCALDSSDSWPWRARHGIGFSNITYEESGTIAHESTSAADVQTAVFIQFYYQAVMVSSMEFSYYREFRGSNPVATFSVSVDGSTEYSDSDSDASTAIVSGTGSVTLPAAVKPVRVQLFCGGGGSGLTYSKADISITNLT